jgi:hypothetical protein
MKKLFVKLFCLLAAAETMAISFYTRPIYKDVRWMGRGNTGVALISDGSAMFYNPAGLGRNEQYHFKIFNPAGAVGSNAYYSSKELSGISDTNDLSDKFAPYLGKPLSLEASLFPHVALPHFALGGFFVLDAAAEYRNPVNPELNIRERDDLGVTTGVGFDVEDRFFFGAAIHYLKRTVIQEEITGATFLNANMNTINALAKRGVGLGLNVGLQYRQPLSEKTSANLGLSVDDLGHTRFRNKSLSSKEPPFQQQSVNLGAAYSLESDHLDAKVLFDLRHLDRSADYAAGKQIFLGAEASLLGMDLRAGFYEGYWTAGFSLRFIPGIDISFATYGEELDSSPGLRENRIFMLGISTGISLKHFGKKKQKYTLDHL